jgi:hypothetical protein
MDSSNYRVRRASLDDLEQLTTLWRAMHFPAEELGKRITEFQVAETQDGKVLGAVGLQIAERQGRIHSEGFGDFAFADQLRPLLWERILTVARNHGLLRLWCQEEAPFWSRCGLGTADAETAQKMPASWRGATSRWLTLKLKDDLEAVISLDKEFALFMESEKQRTARAFQHARTLKLIALFVAVALLGVVLVGVFIVIKNHPNLLGR